MRLTISAVVSPSPSIAWAWNFNSIRSSLNNAKPTDRRGKGGWLTAKERHGKKFDTSVLYRANEVAKAIADGRAILCVEGEKDADNCWRVGFAATCNAHGASQPDKAPKWTKKHSAQLAGADIVVLNDNDPPGYEHAETTCKLSVGVAKRIRRLDLKDVWQDIPAGGDVSDWLGQGHTRDELEDLVAHASDYVPRQSDDAKPDEPPGDDAAELTRLARLPLIEYERTRAAAAKRLGVRAPMLDRLVEAEQRTSAFATTASRATPSTSRRPSRGRRRSTGRNYSTT